MIVVNCTNCGGQMSSRKPSRSGASFCRDAACQNAKARFFRARWKNEQILERDGGPAQAFIKRALHEPRHPCPMCGLEDAVGPYIHRDVRDPMNPCKGTGNVGRDVPLYWLDIVHPDLALRAMAQEQSQ